MPGLPARLSIPLAPRPFSQPSTYSTTIRALRRVPSTVTGPAGTSMVTGKLSGFFIASLGFQPEAMSVRKGSAAVFMWKMWATHARMKPCCASHSLSLRMASPATRLTSGSLLGRAVAMPPMGTAPCLRQMATRRRKMLARKGVVLMSTPKRSGHTDRGSFMTYSKMLAFRSQRAALRPAA